MVNVPLLRETMEHIKNNPQKWAQDYWFVWQDSLGKNHAYSSTIEFEEINSCGSAFCFAGHAALKAGFPAPPKPSEIASVSAYAAWVNDDGVEASDFAMDKLGLNAGQADALFAPGNSMEDLERMVEALIENPDIPGGDLEALSNDYAFLLDDDDDDVW